MPAELPITIRRAVAADVETLAALGAATFRETFGHLYRPADLADYLERSHGRDIWRRTLANAAVATWLAVTPGQVAVGYAVAGPCKLPVDGLEPGAGEVHQLYLLRAWQQRRSGTRLLETALGWLAAEGRSPLYVGVWSENAGAQRLYARYGFEKVGEYGFPVGQQVDREYILRQHPAP